MSKQSEAKQAQGYEERPVIPICANCTHCASVVADSDDLWSWNIKKELRCGIGGFAVKEIGTCNLYERKE